MSGQAGGAAIFSDAPLTIINSTFNSHAPGTDPEYAPLTVRGAEISVSSSTFSGNRGGDISAIDCTDAAMAGTLRLKDVTVLGGESMQEYGAAVRASGSCRLEVSNTVIAGNTPRDCQVSSLSEISASADSDGSCGVSLTLAAPGLGPLADNGGLTLTHEPEARSPLVDAGTMCGATDQRGRARPAAGACDIGAVER